MYKIRKNKLGLTVLYQKRQYKLTADLPQSYLKYLHSLFGDSYIYRVKPKKSKDVTDK